MSFYRDQLLGELEPQRDDDGTLALHLPIGAAPVAGVASDDIGRVVLTILRRPTAVATWTRRPRSTLTGRV